jgi:hypothetical protein
MGKFVINTSNDMIKYKKMIKKQVLLAAKSVMNKQKFDKVINNFKGEEIDFEEFSELLFGRNYKTKEDVIAEADKLRSIALNKKKSGKLVEKLEKKNPKLFAALKESYRTGGIRKFFAVLAKSGAAVKAFLNTYGLILILLVSTTFFITTLALFYNTVSLTGFALGLLNGFFIFYVLMCLFLVGIVFDKLIIGDFLSKYDKYLDKIEAWLNKHKKEQASLVISKRLELAYMGT